MTYAQLFTACPGVWSDADYRSLHQSTYKKADAKNFGSWWQNQENSVTSLVTPCKKDPRWGIIRHAATVKSEAGPFPSKRKYVICLDPQSEYAGNIYYADHKLEIYSKIFFSVLARPFHMGLKTLYHASLIGVVRAIFKGICEDRPIKEIGKSIVRNLIDVVRTPIYEVALIVISIAGLLAIPFSPVLAYDFRAQIGQLSNELYWDRRYELFIDLTPCMRRRANIMDFELNHQKIHKKYVYSDESNPILVALENGL